MSDTVYTGPVTLLETVLNSCPFPQGLNILMQLFLYSINLFDEERYLTLMFT